MSLESILMVVAPICLFTVGVIVLPILVKPRKQSGHTKRYVRGLWIKLVPKRTKTSRIKKYLALLILFEDEITIVKTLSEKKL